MLKVNGEDVMETLHIAPGPRVGWVLGALLEEVLDDPKKNERKYLLKRAEDMGVLSDDVLKEAAIRAREKKDEFDPTNFILYPAHSGSRLRERDHLAPDRRLE